MSSQGGGPKFPYYVCWLQLGSFARVSILLVCLSFFRFVFSLSGSVALVCLCFPCGSRWSSSYDSSVCYSFLLLLSKFVCLSDGLFCSFWSVSQLWRSMVFELAYFSFMCTVSYSPDFVWSFLCRWREFSFCSSVFHWLSSEGWGLPFVILLLFVLLVPYV